MQVATLKNPPRKKKIWPLVLLIVLVVILVFPIVLVYALFYDANTKKIVLKNDLNFKRIGNEIITDSLDHTIDHQKIEINVTENDIDNVLHLAMDRYMKENKFVKKAYVYVKGTAYNFFVDLDGVVIKSRVKVSTSMHENEDKSAFIFEIKDVSVGRVSGIKGPAESLVNRFVNEDTINRFIAQTGLSVKFDQANFALVYSKAGLMNDLQRLTESEGLGLYFDVINNMVVNNLVSFDLSTDNFAEGYIDLTRLRTNELVTDDASHIKVQPEQVSEQCRDNLVALIDHGDVDPETTDIQTVFDYLFRGYDPLTDSQKAVIDTIDFSYVDIDDKTTYKGFDLNDVENKLYDKMRLTVDGDALTDKTLNPRYKKICTLTEEDINDYIASREIVGYTSLLYYKTGDSYKVNYVTVDNFYTNIYKNSENKNIAELVCKVNMNGYHTSLTFATEMGDGTFANNELVFTIKEMKFGEVDAEAISESFYEVIHGALVGVGADSSLRFDVENKAICVNFTDILAYAQGRVEEIVEEKRHEHVDCAEYFALSNLTYEITGSDRNDVGAMELSLVNPIDY